MSGPASRGKSFEIPKQLVWDAWLKVKENGGAPGPDGVTVEQFEANVKDRLYVLWNRMSSGSYFPGPVGAVEIPKKGVKGGARTLGIPNVVDRVAQTVLKLALEPKVEPVFHRDSYGYRPGRSQRQALEVCRKRCWSHDWVVDLDVRKFFDTVPWEKLLKAVAYHTDQKWVLMYVERCLKAPTKHADGTLQERTMGTVQGGPFSPLAANIYLHWGLDAWMAREFPTVPFERWADDVVFHCVSLEQAREVRDAVVARLVEVGLEAHPDKTRIVYCKDSNRGGDYENTSFTFLSYTFRPRVAWNGTQKKRFTSFIPGAAPDRVASFSREMRDLRLHRRTNLTLDQLAADINPKVAGWLEYFTMFYPSVVLPIGTRIDSHLVRWARKKYKRLTRSERRAWAWLKGVRERSPDLFAHWALRY
ncbi:RNA-directed DNA polymerase (Reverse transcriptase) [Parafrankia sp. EAN1pec]|uniref:group II intron reverse transcriptase/maturase n=1 Tax=Parafrankia sp. (strain EAN1pec) TaxID=298653 RepID=UPI0000540388|nr:RNA-directed DNA polymerase (Reverse transcriptase) [Frankia sp. EAN1pec]ABW16070.1 RNA-directed DNA polymerase (Reverse transcriptase) [Frankia sp. EAN1pec]